MTMTEKNQSTWTQNCHSAPFFTTHSHGLTWWLAGS